MQTDSQVSVGRGAHLHPDRTPILDADCDQNNLVSQQPAKRPTRQWAAWTRQEEESFFTALRQVGKNFEKITCRVQSKNKDQVRHYYYRLVRRMNKLLGPGLCLDAKNSKDTNAAMLRWWSLLEKYSCKASKLHLKPRRFKIFVEALENQLLKDRKRNVRKQHSQGENCSPTASNTISSHNRASGNDNRSVKLVLVDSQNIQKLGPGRVPLKRNGNSINRSNNKGDPTAMKPPRKRQKGGAISAASYKKWEKAAIAGVSLVADAAEHLERTTNDKEVENGHTAFGKMNSNSVGKVSPHLPNSSQSLFVENNTPTSMKLKLQLFPIDDNTRRALEMDKHNPHLELTLSARKRISSVVEHLNRKWGNSSVACGELILFPYSVQRENLVAYCRWTQNSILTAAEMYTMIGSPPVFRLRYGWFSNEELVPGALWTPLASSIPAMQTLNMETGKEQTVGSTTISQPSGNKRSEKFEDQGTDQLTSVNQDQDLSPSSAGLPTRLSTLGGGSTYELVEPSDPAASGSWNIKENSDRIAIRQFEDLDDLRLSNGTALSAGEWADSLTNVSVGDLLAEVPQDMDVDYLNPPVVGNSQCFQQTPFSCDSFDAAIAAHISRQQGKIGFQQCVPSHTASIWDAEETRDAFSFHKNSTLHQEVRNIYGADASKASKPITRKNLGCAAGLDEELPEGRVYVDSPIHADPMDECTLDNPTKDFNSLSDIYWPDSLGLLDLDVPYSKYHNEDLILSDSLK